MATSIMSVMSISIPSRDLLNHVADGGMLLQLRMTDFDNQAHCLRVSADPDLPALREQEFDVRLWCLHLHSLTGTITSSASGLARRKKFAQ